MCPAVWRPAGLCAAWFHPVSAACINALHSALTITSTKCKLTRRLGDGFAQHRQMSVVRKSPGIQYRYLHEMTTNGNKFHFSDKTRAKARHSTYSVFVQLESTLSGRTSTTASPKGGGGDYTYRPDCKIMNITNQFWVSVKRT